MGPDLMVRTQLLVAFADGSALSERDHAHRLVDERELVRALPVRNRLSHRLERGRGLVVRAAAHVVVERAGEEDVLLGRGLRGLRERDRRVPHLLAGFLSAAQGVQVVTHKLLYERPRLGELLLGRHRQEGEAEEEGEEGDEEFHFRNWKVVLISFYKNF